MNHNSNDPARFDGRDNPAADGTQPLEGGVLPEDFGERLERLKEAGGLSWRGFAKALGVDPKQLRMWRRKGVEPCGGAMLSIARFASGTPGGMEILLGEGFQMTFFEEGS